MSDDSMKAARVSISDRIHKAKRTHPKALCAVFILACLLFAGGCSPANNSATNAKPSEDLSVMPAHAGVLSFTLESDQWDTGTDESIAVLIKGESEDHALVNEKYKAVVGEKHETNLKPGQYELMLFDGKASKGNKLFVATTVPITFDGASDYEAVLHMRLDTEKMKKVEEEAAAKAAEQARQKAAEEEAARQKAAEEAQARAAAKAEATVYIAASGNGKKYHNNPNCSRMNGTIAMSVSEAERRGYTPCKKCY